jgi:hypothetical protein
VMVTMLPRIAAATRDPKFFIVYIFFCSTIFGNGDEPGSKKV